MTPHSDQQLVRRVLARFPWFTLLLLATQVGVFALSNLNDIDSGMFALQTADDDVLRHWAFNVHEPLKNFGFNLVSSAFIHSNETHLLSNLLPAAVVLSLLELKSNAKTVVWALIVGHLSALFGASLAHIWLNQPPLATGLSGAVMCAASLLLFKRWNKFALLPLVLLSIVYAATHFSGFVAHSFSLFAGAFLFFTTERKK